MAIWWLLTPLGRFSDTEEILVYQTVNPLLTIQNVYNAYLDGATVTFCEEIWLSLEKG
jgi:hypothetical protein